jgi:hypothetical protein
MQLKKIKLKLLLIVFLEAKKILQCTLMYLNELLFQLKEERLNNNNNNNELRQYNNIKNNNNNLYNNFEKKY